MELNNRTILGVSIRFGFWDRLRILFWGGLGGTVTLMSENAVGLHIASTEIDWVGRRSKSKTEVAGCLTAAEGDGDTLKEGPCEICGGPKQAFESGQFFCRVCALADSFEGERR